LDPDGGRGRRGETLANVVIKLEKNTKKKGETEKIEKEHVGLY